MKQDMTIAAVQDCIKKTSNQIMALINQLEANTGCKVESVDLDRVGWVNGGTQVIEVNLDVKI